MEKNKKDDTGEDLGFNWFDCPICKKGRLVLSKHIHELPDGDKYLIMKFECDKCDFTKNDLIPVETPIKPGKFILNVNEKEDLKSKVFRSSSGVLEIPELEMEIEPGPAADFYITNIEGVLFRMKDAVSFFKKGLSEENQKVNKILENIDRAINGEFKFTLIITDELGGSYIVPFNEKSLKIEYF